MVSPLSGSHIEHRYSERKPVNLSVLIIKNRIPIAVAKVRDLCSNGMCVESDLLNIKKYSTLEVEIAIPQSDTTRYHRVPGLVIHNSNGSTGIQFSELDQNGKLLIRRLLTKDFGVE